MLIKFLTQYEKFKFFFDPITIQKGCSIKKKTLSKHCYQKNKNRNKSNITRLVFLGCFNNETIADIPDELSNLLYRLLKEGKVNEIYGKITASARSVPRERWVQSAGI